MCFGKKRCIAVDINVQSLGPVEKGFVLFCFQHKNIHIKNNQTVLKLYIFSYQEHLPLTCTQVLFNIETN